MKLRFALVLIFTIGLVQANDVPCQTDILKPIFKAPIIVEEYNKPAEITIAEARKRLKKNQTENSPKKLNTSSKSDKKTASEPAKKSTRFGGIFDLLLPAKLRNPVK